MISLHNHHHHHHLLIISLVIFITFFTNANGSVNRNGYLLNGDLRWETTRTVATVARRGMEEEGVGNISSLVLAGNRTHRRDPLDDFKWYTGGWNISDKHYWASVGFTASPFVAIAAAWFIIFGLTLSFICCCYCCCRREPYGYSRTCYALSLICLILFTLAAIGGSLLLYTAQGKFHSSTKNTLNYVVGQADDTVMKLHKVSGYLSAAENIGVDRFTLPSDLVSKINDVQSKINSSASTLSDKTHDNSRKISKFLNIVRIILMVVAAVMLLLAFVGFLLSVFGVQCLVYFLVILGWILVTVTFVLCGVFLQLNNMVGDTCVAMEQWVQNPTAHTALDDILPCVDNGTAQEILSRSKDVTQQIVGLIDNVITNVANADSPSHYNLSGPSLPVLCNPYNTDLSNRTCATGEVEFQNATEVWKNYVCQVSTEDTCITTGRLTPEIYHQMSSGVNASYGLYNYSPFMVELVDCAFVRSTFSDISTKYCHGLLKNTEWIYIGLVVVSTAVMFSLIFWVIYARERRHRVYTKRAILMNSIGQ
ncbi:hypothetical protein Droror1_Dr00015919 [Drosera rotundifolia]